MTTPIVEGQDAVSERAMEAAQRAILEACRPDCIDFRGMTPGDARIFARTALAAARPHIAADLPGEEEIARAVMHGLGAKARWDVAYSVARAVLALLRSDAGGGWRPIATAPKDGSYILVSNGSFVDVARWSHGSFGGFAYNGDVLYWQPLPAPPSQDGEPSR